MEPGAIVNGRYRLESVIGVGGAGVVWKAVQLPFDDVVALKQIPLWIPGGEPPERVRARTLREARNTRVLRGAEHVIGVSDYVEDPDNVWLAMEYVDALNLAELVVAAGPLPAPEVAWIGARVARALAAGHLLEIQHRDVKPGNVLIGRDGTTIKLGDYGISRREDDPDVTVVGSIPATLPFAAPEVVREQLTTTASDVWSLGATLYFAVEGQPPFGRPDDRASLVEAVRRGDVLPMRQAGPDLGPLIERMLVATRLGRIDADTIAEKLDRIATPLSNPTRAVLVEHHPKRVDRSPTAVTRELSRPAPVTDLGPVQAAPVRPAPDAVPGRVARTWTALRGLRKRRLAVVLAVVLLGGAAATGLLATLPAGTSTGSAPPTTPATSARPVPSGLADLPASVGYRALSDAGLDVDTCQLVDRDRLGALGPVTVTLGFDYEGCLATVATPAHGNVRITYDVAATRSSAATGARRPFVDLGEVGIAASAFPASPSTFCANYLILSDDSQITMLVEYPDEEDDARTLCDVADTAAVGAVLTLERLGRVPRDPARRTSLALSGTDPCTLVDRAQFPELNRTPSPGFAGWSCFFSSDDAGRIQVEYQLGSPFPRREKIGRFWTRSGLTYRESSGEGRCSVLIEVRAKAVPAPGRYDGLAVRSYGRTPPADQCARALRAAEMVVTKLPAPLG